ncbi:hypothetical protein [Streptomyces sp. NPDC004266]|uniref:hypothetical protein n=1 Tax=Streptomyces sp. NPDC004266 TaxID=3364693 RepID=UPI00368C24A5
MRTTFTVRAAVVFLLTVLTATAAGVLAALTGAPAAGAVLAAGAAAGAALPLFDALIDH